MLFSLLQCKEVICVSTGQRLGFISDVQVDVGCGTVNAIIVPGQGRMFGILGSREDYIIPWSAIKRIGPDIVLVDIAPESCCRPKRQRGLPF